MSVEEMMDKWENKFAGMLGGGRKQNALDDMARHMEGKMEAALPKIDPMKAVNAMLGGSSAANNATIAAYRSTANANAQGPQEKAAKGIEDLKKIAQEHKKAADEQNKKLDALREAIEDITTA